MLRWDPSFSNDMICSFGVLLWEWVKLEHPFGLADPVLIDATERQGESVSGADGAGQQAKSIFLALKQRAVPWLSQDTSIASPIASLIRSCCHPMPAVRPPMAFVAHSLLLLLSGDSISTVAPDQDPEETKLRVHDVVSPVGNTTRVHVRDAEVLQRLADDGDPTASAFLGTAIWQDAVDYDLGGDGNFISVTAKDVLLGTSSSLQRG